MPNAVRHMACAVALTLAVSASALPGQRARVPANTAVLRVDTLHAEIRGAPQVPGEVFKSTVIRRLARGTGAEAGVLVRTTDVEARGDTGPGLRSQVRTLVDAATLGFRRETTRIMQPSGGVISESRRDLMGGRLRDITIRGDDTDTTWVPLPAAGGVLYAAFDDVVRSLPEAPPAGTRREVVVTTPPFHQTLVIDSLGAVDAAGQRAIVGHLDSAGVRLATIHAGIDARTRDVAVLTWRMPNGVVSTFTRVNGQRQAGAPARDGRSGTSEARGPLAGGYRLQGVREMASEIVLRRDGRFTYALAYGALDESTEGRWRVRNGQVVLQSDGTAHAPSVRLTSATGTTTDSVVVLVTDTAGTPVHGIEVDAVQPRTGTSFARAQQGRHVVRYTKGDAPTELSVGYDVFDFMVNFPIEGKPKAVYRFVFDRGDLGRYRFEDARLAVEGDTLVLVRNGRRMEYVRQ